MIDKTQQMDLGDIFNYTFTLLKTILLKALLYTLIFILPVAVFCFLLSVLFSGFTYEDTDPAFRQAMQVGLPVLGFYFYMFLLFFSTQFSQIGVFHLADKTIAGEEVTLGKMFRATFSISFWRIVLMYILMAIPFIGGTIVVGILTAIVGDLTGAGINGMIMLLLIPLYLSFIYFSLAWIYGKPLIICEGSTATAALKKSYRLVKGNWWRTFGRFFLFSLIAGLAASLLSVPLGFFFFGHNILSNLPQPGQQDIAKMTVFITALMQLMLFVTTISMIITAAISPVFELITCYDLRIRNNEFTPELSPFETLLTEKKAPRPETDFMPPGYTYTPPETNADKTGDGDNEHN